jgi:hypothetical protein
LVSITRSHFRILLCLLNTFWFDSFYIDCVNTFTWYCSECHTISYWRRALTSKYTVVTKFQYQYGQYSIDSLFEPIRLFLSFSPFANEWTATIHTTWRNETFFSSTIHPITLRYVICTHTECFLWERPFVSENKAHGSVKEQRKIKTFLYTKVPFPYMKTRLEVVKKEQVSTCPLLY